MGTLHIHQQTWINSITHVKEHHAAITQKETALQVPMCKAAVFSHGVKDGGVGRKCYRHRNIDIDVNLK